MPGEDKEKVAFDLDFGIEDNTLGAGDKEALSAFLGSSNANPDDVSANDNKTNSSTTNKTTTLKPVIQKQQQKVVNKEEGKEDQVDVEETILGGGNEEEKEEENTENQEEGKNEGGKTTMAALAEEFVGLGLFHKEEGEEIDPNLSPEEFLKIYQANKNRDINDTIENFLSRYGDDYKEMFDAVFVKGVDPKSYLNLYTKLSDIANLDMAVEANQVKVYSEYLRRQGFPEDKIEARVQKAKVNGDLEEDSTDFQKILVDQDSKELETQKEIKEKKTLEDKRQKQVFAQNVNKVLVEKLKEKEFDGIPLSEQIARSTVEYLTSEKWKLGNGETLTDFDKFILELKRPENHSLKVKLALLAQNNFDLSKVKIKEKNDSTSKAFEWATKGKSTNTNKNGQKVQIKETEPFI